jgi:hypothetical protein
MKYFVPTNAEKLFQNATYVKGRKIFTTSNTKNRVTDAKKKKNIIDEIKLKFL